ncbi:hypothetical protein [Rufibacter ruber]|uniref:hypothetical protein n=1 Tax=Rufibacter ruber TaxID=1783499 RepID=UPI00082DB6E0|nr:hypothetical protein [Rufibacter ruber]
MAQPLINGVEYSWGNITISAMGQVINGISGISYDDKQMKENVYGAGNMPVARVYGKYEASGKITLHTKEIEALTKAAPNRRLQDIPQFNITVSFAPLDGSEIVTHRLRGVEFVTNSRDLKNSDGAIETDLELIISHIEW